MEITWAKIQQLVGNCSKPLWKAQQISRDLQSQYLQQDSTLCNHGRNDRNENDDDKKITLVNTEALKINYSNKNWKTNRHTSHQRLPVFKNKHSTRQNVTLPMGKCHVTMTTNLFRAISHPLASTCHSHSMYKLEMPMFTHFNDSLKGIGKPKSILGQFLKFWRQTVVRMGWLVNLSGTRLPNARYRADVFSVPSNTSRVYSLETHTAWNGVS